ncbi:signal peptidase II [Lachnospiraceae bacterium WCA-9-b2]|uniref:Lipoprotein signal peptidase n=1 Tax=Sporofaciens musculi TaxID=2681861 RepID=A0A7X3MGP2_9FIRM|nr:signal peptidase II [Sporofaciens musculi]MCI9422838.1 signal peptidase II [Dorea sp.]MXP76086.1 signal peptidase II [Sporofaciens musculi]
MAEINVTKKESGRGIYYLAAVTAVSVLVCLDQFTKHLVLEKLKGNPPFIIWDGVFQLEYLENRGAAFGLFQGQRLFFFVSVFLVSIAFIWFFLKVPMEGRFVPLCMCAVFIMAGAWGNCVDRIVLNYVVDFLYFKLIDFPIFNVADIYVTVATFSLAVLICFYYKEEDLERIVHR